MRLPFQRHAKHNDMVKRIRLIGSTRRYNPGSAFLSGLIGSMRRQRADHLIVFNA
jgi:hypothetical protein